VRDHRIFQFSSTQRERLVVEAAKSPGEDSAVPAAARSWKIYFDWITCLQRLHGDSNGLAFPVEDVHLYLSFTYSIVQGNDDIGNTAASACESAVDKQ